MRKILILGSGAGGTIVANMLRKELPESDWEITIIDRDETHHYQAGYLFIPFGVYSESDVIKPKKEFIPKGVEFVLDEVTNIDAGQRQVKTSSGAAYDYDWLVIATGCNIHPEEIDGMMDGWGKHIFDYYTLDGSLALREKLRYFNSGKIVLNIAEIPYKCPIAPLEFVFMADWFFTVGGVRDKVEIELVTPLDNVFTKPVAAKILATFAQKKNIKVTPFFDLAQVNVGEKSIESHKGDKVGYDLLVAIPPNMGDKCLIDSGVSDPVGYVPTDNHTLKHEKDDRIFVVGDTTNVPTSKAGSVAHYMAYTVVENLIREINGHEGLATFDGHATCFLASGFEKAILLDFNYKVEPLPGKFPFPGMGPFSLLQESLSNHWGKMMFRWVYWNLMMKGLDMPLEPQMNLAGKIRKVALKGGGPMTNEEQLLERMERLESQMAPLTQSATAVSELREELAPRLNEAVHYLIAELADVEADFQLEDLLRLIKNAMRNVNNLNFTLDQLKNIIDFAVIAEPLLKSTVPELIAFLDDLEEKGVLRLLILGLDVMKKIGSTYTHEEMAQIGDGVVRMVGILKSITSPEALDVLEGAAKIPAEANFAGAKPAGPFGLMGAMGDQQVRKGLGVMLELTKAAANIGRPSETALENR